MAQTGITRRTVDLSAYPELVVIYLGMRVNRFRGMATLLKFGPRISAAVAAKPDGLLLHEPVIYSIFPLMSACGNTGATSGRSKPGRDPCRTSSGGAASCATAAALVSGTKLTSKAEVWRRSTTIFLRLLDSWLLPMSSRRRAPCFPHDAVPEWLGRALFLRPFRKRTLPILVKGATEREALKMRHSISRGSARDLCGLRAKRE